MKLIRQFLEKLICSHQWKEIRNINLYRNTSIGKGELPYGNIFLYQCTKCGKFKKIEIIQKSKNYL